MTWQGSSYLKENLTKSALTTGGFLILDKMYNHSPIDLKKGALSFDASYLSETGSDYFSSMMSNGTMKKHIYNQLSQKDFMFLEICF